MAVLGIVLPGAEWRGAADRNPVAVRRFGLQGLICLQPARRASSLVDTLRSPCINTIGGLRLFVFQTSVLTTLCSFTLRHCAE